MAAIVTRQQVVSLERQRCRWERVWHGLAIVGLVALLPVGRGGETSTSPDLARRFEEIRRQLPAPTRHFEDGDSLEWTDRLDLLGHYRGLQQEKLAGKWFAALISTERGERNAIRRRFATWEAFAGFLQDQQPLVELWVRTVTKDGGVGERRLTAMEVAALRQAGQDAPTTLRLTLWNSAARRAETCQVEFAFEAAAVARRGRQAYEHHRATLSRLQEVLSDRNEEGRFSAIAQWSALHQAVREGSLTIRHHPVPPTTDADLYVAFEYAVDEQGLFRELVRVYRESEIERRIDDGVQSLRLRPLWEGGEERALGFRRRPFREELEPAINPILGQDVVELRVLDWRQPDPRRWNAVEFGEPDLLRESALARFGLINAHLERQRKQVAWRKGRYDVYAEFVFLGLNLGGGFGGVGFPLGDAARLAYNLAVTPQFVSGVPSVREMRELFAWLAAYRGHPRLGRKPAELLDRRDLEELRRGVGRISEAQLRDTLERITDDDLRAMLSLARFQGLDTRYRLVVDLLSTAARVSGQSGSGLLRDIFSNPYFALNGDISIKNVLAASLGSKDATSLSGATLEQMVNGDRDAICWLSFFDLTVDLRAILNTVHRLRAETQADRELRQPFPHAPRLTDLAAYEIRVFGFPLLLFHKRGLLKADMAAYDSDYAYSLLGTRIVHHFRTREEFEQAIAARHLFPLGYVKVRDAAGRLQESRLAVFAHNLVEGKHRGRTALVLYGLKAYHEYSAYIDRECARFAEYEKLLREGGVIERLVDAEDRNALRGEDCEPQLHRGLTAREQRFSGVLGPLLELRRLATLRQWELPAASEDEQLGVRLRARFREGGIELAEGPGGPYLWVDRWYSAFRFRRQVEGRWREYLLVAVASPADIQREAAKADVAFEVEAWRRACLAGELSSVVLLNEAVPEGGGHRLGPLLRDAGGRVLGAGVRTNAAAIDELWGQLAGLPGSVWTMLHAQHFSGVPVDLDVDRDGRREKVFLTVEFPAAANVRSRRIHPASGQPEVIVLQEGLCRTSITPFRIVEFEYDVTRQELHSRMYQNLGTLEEPRPGPLVEETTTVEEWFRQPAEPDPHLPVLAKVRFNHVTGEVSYEVYGGFPLPVRVHNEQWIAESRYRGSGWLESTRMWHLGGSAADAERPALEQLLDPVRGRERFVIRPVATNAPLEADGTRPVLPAEVERIDLLKGLTNRIWFDPAHHGRKVAEVLVDPFDGTRTFTTLTTNVYREEFHCGLIPCSSERRDVATGALLARIEVEDYDPWRRRLRGTETDATGKRTTVVWSSRWENPVQIDSALRRTEYVYDPWETRFTGRTFCRDTGEVLSSYGGAYDLTNRLWRVERVLWYRAGVTNWTEDARFSVGGKRIRTRASDNWESRAFYDDRGLLRTSQLAFTNPASGQFDNVVRVESGFDWREGACTAEVQTFVEGRPHDRFRSMTDAEGRVARDGIREFPGLSFWTEVEYEGATDRIRESREFQNGFRRLVRTVQPEVRDADGRLAIPVVTRPGWGLTSTQMFVLGSPWGRPSSAMLENGERVVVTRWFDGTVIPRESEIVDRGGRVRERFVAELGGFAEGGVLCDRVARYRVTPWGGAGLAVEEGLVRGTDVKLFQLSADRKIVYDPNRLHPAPLYAVDPTARSGVPVEIDGRRVRHVLALFRTETNGVEIELPGRGREPGIREVEVDLQSLFYHRVADRLTDLRGSLVDEKTGQMPNQGPELYVRERVLAAAEDMVLQRRYRYFYEPGWLAEQAPRAGGRALAFAREPPPSGTRGYAVNLEGRREFATRVVGSRTLRSVRSSEGKAVESAWVFRVLDSPRLLEWNPHLPGIVDHWTVWSVEERAREGSFLHQGEHYYDAQGRQRTVRTMKWTDSREPALRTVYHVAAPAEEWPVVLPAGRDSVELALPEERDLGTTDFLCWFLESSGAGRPSLVLADAAGARVQVAEGRPDYRGHRVAYWYPDAANAAWFPDAEAPVQMVAVTAAPVLTERGGLLLVAVHELEAAGLEVRRLQSLTLVRPSGDTGVIRLSHCFRLDRGGPGAPWRRGAEVQVARRPGLEGISRLESVRRWDSAEEDLSGLFSSAVVYYNHLPIAITRPPVRPSPYPTLVFINHSETESPEPLYAVSSRDGRLIEHYQKVEFGDVTHVYSIVHGFKIPQYEVFRGDVLGDETAPGFMAYGYDYHARVEYQKAGGWVGGALSSLRNRIAANSFNYYGDKLFRHFGGDFLGASYAAQFRYTNLHRADAQATNIVRLPTLAQVLLPFREPLWEQPRPAPEAAGLSVDRDALRLRLAQLHVERFATNLTPFYDPTYLVPTPPGTHPDVERHIDTVAEAAVIRLALRLGEPGLAAELMEFYRAKSEGGAKPLHASYDAETGTAMVHEYGLPRSLQSQPTAEAQVAISEAALELGLRHANRVWLDFGRHLLTRALREFRSASTNEAPRGLSHHRALPRLEVLGFSLWPDERRYPVDVNARVYLLLRRWVAEAAAAGEDPEWLANYRRALAEQEAWLRQRVLPEVERTGVVPAALGELQDVQGRTNAVSVDRWTGADPWLAFLEAAPALGVPASQSRVWIENLVRVHGVRCGSAEGLDFSVPLLRSEAISSELTARLLRVAKLLGHEAIARYAEAALASLRRRGDGFPVVVTAVSPRFPIKTGLGATVFPLADGSGWPDSLAVYEELLDRPAATSLSTRSRPPQAVAEEAAAEREVLSDMMVFILIAATFYLLVLLAAVFWWRFRKLRKAPVVLVDERLVPDPVMQQAEERWAKRVLGVQTPAGAEHTRFSNGPVEQNFLMQLRAVYKMVVEWRRQELGREEKDPGLAEVESDSWLNGIDEFACVIGIYMRFVIKAGAKDGRPRAEVLEENEDSNHIWSRLVMYLSEFQWAMGTLLRNNNNAATPAVKTEIHGEITRLLEMFGVRQRPAAFDARRLLNYPANPAALDLLILQKPGVRLPQVLLEISLKLRIPFSHLAGVIGKYKAFRRREALDPIHPYLIEFAKIMPHFVLMGLGALVLYNQQTLADSPMVPYLWHESVGLVQGSLSWLWGLPLLCGMALSCAGHFVRVYRFEGSMLPRERPMFIMDSTFTYLLGKKHTAMPEIRPGWAWNPRVYDWSGWTLRTLGCLGLGLTLLLGVKTPSFATFLMVKGILAMLVLTEAAGVILPLIATWVSQWLQDHVSRHPDCGGPLRFLNRLNFSATRPASPLWLSLKYVTQPTVPSGDFTSFAQAILFYFGLAAAFFFIGGFLCQQILSLWFAETYLNASNGKLFLGGVLFWNTMYLLRYGLFLLSTAIASLIVTYPLRTLALGGALAQLALVGFAPLLPEGWRGTEPTPWVWAGAALLLGLAFFEEPLRRCGRVLGGIDRREERRRTRVREQLERIRQDPQRKVGIVYMSGDDLAHTKLTPELLVGRWELLKEKYGSCGLRLLAGMAGDPDATLLREWFAELYDLEKRQQVTLWHPAQLVAPGEESRLSAELGLRLPVADDAARRRLLVAWHVRRWLVTMMSTAGHSQDTAINLVDIATRLHAEGLAANAVFYLIQNKYDDRDNNRPVQLKYGDGELGQREKLSRLLEALAPGLKAYNVQNWTPFGFKAGGMTGMDLVHEESLKVTTMVVLDRNATVNDLDAFFEDLAEALTDPDLVIVIPGRGTTNTLTEIGQASQMIEEGHRSFLKGLLSGLGGRASECLGTGWGNIVAYTYGRVQRALLDPLTLKMPLTSRQYRGSTFAMRSEGLIGFTPHAVGISEDTWAVSQAAHNLAALGGCVRFRLSRAMWHKIRETWSHAEWLASFPRWSGGYLQMMQDAVMQRINDFGMFSVFSREIRSNSGRCYLSAPFALVNILLLPLAIIADVTPFVQILIVLWNFGFVMNQVLTLHGLNVYLESAGFSRVLAVAGAGIAGGIAWAVPSLQAYAPGLTVAGGCIGGFWIGLTRWIYTRLRDVILFGPQLILHTLGQVMRQTIEFTTSGAAATDAQGVNMAFRAWAGPREDQPLARFPHFINLQTVVWVVGFPSVLLNLAALSNLDMFNVTLLLPSLLFSASVLAGPFLMTPKPGREAGWRVHLVKWLSWPAAFGFFVAVSMLIARRGAWQMVGVAVLLVVLGLVLQPAARHLGHRLRLAASRRRFVRWLEAAGLSRADATKVFGQLVQHAADAAQLRTTLAAQKIPEESAVPMVEAVRRDLAPLLEAPSRPGRGPRSVLWQRVAAESGRSFLLALLTFLWLFVVPVPGLFVYAAGNYRTSMTLAAILHAVLLGVGVAIGGYWIGRALQEWWRRWPRGSSIDARARRAFARLLDSVVLADSSPPQETARVFALFTDLKTYVDQRADAYAGRCLERIEQSLSAGGGGGTAGPGSGSGTPRSTRCPRG